jgi:hypothetical protein
MIGADWRAIWLALMAIVVGIVLMLTSGCGSALSTATTVSVVYGEAVVVSGRALEAAREPTIERLSAQARAEQPDDADARVARFLELTEPLRSLSSAQDGLEAAYLAMAAALRAWEASVGDEASWQRALACTGASLLRVARGLQAIGVELPAVLATLAQQTVDFAENLCGTGPPTGTATGVGGP